MCLASLPQSSRTIESADDLDCDPNADGRPDEVPGAGVRHRLLDPAHHQQLTIFVNLIGRGATPVYNVGTVDLWVMDPGQPHADVVFPMASTALDKVRGVEGVAWAVPHLRSVASVRTPAGDLEGVSIIGVDNATLIGMPLKLLRGRPEDLGTPDAVFIDDIGARRLFEGVDPIGQRLELNDQRAIVRGIVDVDPSFTAQVVLYTRYSQALNFVPGTRNRLSFVLARAAPGVDPAALSARVASDTGLRVRTRDEFARDGIDFIVENTGIPINFGITGGAGLHRRYRHRRPDLQPVHPRQHQAVRSLEGDRRP
jgi:putative ABC transport system permease protein